MSHDPTAPSANFRRKAIGRIGARTITANFATAATEPTRVDFAIDLDATTKNTYAAAATPQWEGPSR